MIAKLTIACSTPNDGSDLGRRLRAPFHGIGPNGVEGDTDEEFEKNVAFTDRVMEAMFRGVCEASNSTPDGGLEVDLEIGEGEVDLELIQEQVKQAVSIYLKKDGTDGGS